MQSVKESLVKELERKRSKLKEAKLNYLKSNIELMDIVHQPSHQSSPVNRWSTATFFETKETLPEIAEEPETVIGKPKEQDNTIEIETIVHSNEITEKPNEIEVAEATPEADKNKIIQNVGEIRKASEKAETKEEPISKEAVEETTEEELLLDALTSKINSIKNQLVFSEDTSTTSENEIKLPNVSSKYLKPTLSFLMLYYNNKDINSYTHDQLNFLPNDFCFLAELLFVSDYMMMEVTYERM
eukprot:TRINITY_DN2675_c0_g2_i3.p1 TRINITY_DN2675_c0_g2~~TRINITY_DN2675_c0_g2_i3.p1  ORF type:complete len:243 (-),score=84.87 TRINITY_DN2675_c0_g2_i3:1176-1904(-)